jgi:hypothetical protein
MDVCLLAACSLGRSPPVRQAGEPNMKRDDEKQEQRVCGRRFKREKQTSRIAKIIVLETMWGACQTLPRIDSLLVPRLDLTCCSYTTSTTYRFDFWGENPGGHKHSKKQNTTRKIIASVRVRLKYINKQREIFKRPGITISFQQEKL